MKRTSLPPTLRGPKPDAPFVVPALESVAPPPAASAEEATPGLTSWGSEAIRLLSAELGYTPAAPTPPGAAGDPVR